MKDQNTDASRTPVEEPSTVGIIDNSPIGLYIVQDGKFQMVNLQFQKETGYTESELVGQESLKLVHQEDRDSVRANAILMLRRHLASPYEYRVVRKDGETIHILETVASVEYRGKRAVFGNFMNITERKRISEALRQSEETLRLMFESLADGVIVCDTSGRIAQVNLVKARMHGYERKEDLIGKSVMDLIAEKDRARARANLELAWKGVPLQHVEYTFQCKGGREFPGEASTALIRDAAGQPLGFIGVSRDITEHKKLEARLLVADRLASVGELASGIAHEINNPLTSILGFAELLSGRQDLPADAVSGLEIIYRESRRAATTVRNLLAFARGQTTMKAPIDVNAAIQNVLSLRAYQHRVNNIQVVTLLAENLPPVVADSFQFQQALINIIINAEYFMVKAHGKGTLTVTTTPDEDSVKISVTDDGPGIARKDLGRIFDPFFTTKEVGKGTGLGLSICHGIVTQHGGRIWAESEPGKGATFIIELPVGVAP